MMPALLKKTPAAKLLIVGDGPERETLAEQACLLGVEGSVIFAGYKPWDEIGLYYRLSDIFMTASTSETQGLTYIEAMASHIPVAVKRDPSFEGLIRHRETGYMFENDEDAAETAAYALTNPEEAGAVAEKGLHTILPFSSGVFAKRVEDVYNEILKNKKDKKKG
jgi:1,2-diacylglycerol 3-alpha-glucosyltransferase